MSQSIEASEAIAFFDALRRRERTLVFWSYDRSNGQERLTEGFVNDVSIVFLEIDPRNGDSFLIEIFGVDFVKLDRAEAAFQISDIAPESYDYVLGFAAGKYGICIMGKDPRDGTAPTPSARPSTPED